MLPEDYKSPHVPHTYIYINSDKCTGGALHVFFCNWYKYLKWILDIKTM